MTPNAIDSIPFPARQALSRASEATGVDFSLLVETARRESSFNAAARAPTSSATGLFQFIDSTWLETVRRHGAKHGLDIYASQITLENGRPVVRDPRLRQQILDLRYDPELSARMGAELAKENAQGLERRLGRAPKAGEVYAAHVLGVSGAVRMIEAAEAGAPDAAVLFPREAQANRWLFFARDGSARSPQALLARFEMPGSAAPPSQPAPMAATLTFASAQEAPPAAERVARAYGGAEVRAPSAIEALQKERAAAVMMAEMLIQSMRTRTIALASGRGVEEGVYGLGAYRRAVG
jgi:hypothetical protein